MIIFYTVEYWSNVSDEAKDLIKHLLVLDVDERYTVEQALNHQWVTQSVNKLSSRDLGRIRILFKCIFSISNNFTYFILFLLIANNLATLRRYNARRKLRAGIKAVSYSVDSH